MTNEIELVSLGLADEPSEAQIALNEHLVENAGKEDEDQQQAQSPNIAPDPPAVPNEVTPDQQKSEFDQVVAQSNAILDALMARIGPVNLQSKYCNLFIYGLPGVGKSVLLGTAPHNLIIDVEDGAKSIGNHPNLIKANNPQSLEFRSVFQVEQLVKFMKEGNPAFDQFEVLSVDSYSSLVERALVEWVRSQAAMDASRNPWLPVGTDYNINTQHMKQLATDIHDLDKHVVFLAHADEVKDESTGRILIRPSLTPKLAKAIAGLFDLVGFLTSEIGPTGAISNQKLQIYPTDKVLAKTRIGGLPPIIENPTLPMIFEAYAKARESGDLH